MRAHAFNPRQIVPHSQPIAAACPQGYLTHSLQRSRPMAEIVTAAMLVIGDEILSGRTKDRNIGHLADIMTAIGVDLKEVRIVAGRRG